MRKKIILGLILIILVLPLVFAQEASVCCEKTVSGAWCQNTKEENCDTNYKQTPTSCDATSFCKLGCCFESKEGLCMENTPKRICDENKGVWGDSAECDTPQCSLGCCVLGNQAALVTLVRCKKLSAFYRLITDFRTNIQNEMECIGVAQAQDRGACVYETDFTRTCKFTTRTDCLSKGVFEQEEETITNTSVGFFKNYLCSAESLNTACRRTTQTTCVDGKDEVYFVDSCGNPANIYDASKKEKQEYWEKIIPKEESCGYGDNNANSAGCGNCDYYLGSYCKDDKICVDLNCYKCSDGKDHKHGEAWCSYDGNIGEGADSVGSRHFRHICVNGEELIESCDDYRNQVCIEDEIDTGKVVFSQAACRVNRWQECILQTSQKDCENADKRDCYWLEGAIFTGQGQTTGETVSSSEQEEKVFGGGITGQFIFGGDEEEDEFEGIQPGVVIASGLGLCVPNVPPGLRFWEEGETAGVCSQANAKCVVVYEEGLIGSENCVENCECLEESWAVSMNNVCTSLGDCGGYVNYIGRYTDDGYDWIVPEGKRSLSQGIVSQIKSKAGI